MPSLLLHGVEGGLPLIKLCVCVAVSCFKSVRVAFAYCAQSCFPAHWLPPSLVPGPVFVLTSICEQLFRGWVTSADGKHVLQEAGHSGKACTYPSLHLRGLASTDLQARKAKNAVDMIDASIPGLSHLRGSIVRLWTSDPCKCGCTRRYKFFEWEVCEGAFVGTL